MSDVIYNVPDSAGGQLRLQLNGANLELLRDSVVIDSRPLASVDGDSIEIEERSTAPRAAAPAMADRAGCMRE